MHARVGSGEPSNILRADADGGRSACRPDAEQIALFVDVVFSWCDGLIPIRGFAEKGRKTDAAPRTIWTPADGTAGAQLEKFALDAARDGLAVYVIPGTVAARGRARAEDVVQMQAAVLDLDDGDVQAKLAHVTRWLGQPTIVVESGGITHEGQPKLHVWWKLTEPAGGDDLKLLCQLRAEIASKVAGDPHFRSAHQPIRVPGSIYQKYDTHALVQIRSHHPVEVDLTELAARVSDMPALFGTSGTVDERRQKPSVQEVLTTPVREGATDSFTRFEGASAAIGHFVRMMHEGRLSRDEGWKAICDYNAAMLRPPWPLDRLRAEAARLWKRHIERNGPARAEAAAPERLPMFTLGAFIDDRRAMPEDIIGPRVLTPGGLLVLGGAPKVGKSDFLISWLAHMAAGVPFLNFVPPRPLRVFYLQAEIQYDYLRERIRRIGLPNEILAAARNNFVATPKLRMLLDAEGVIRVAGAVRAAFPGPSADVLVIDPIRNLFDGGPDGAGENDNDAMMFFLRERVEALREAIDPDCGVILAHHTKKLTKQQVKDDPFLALSGASSLRGYYSSGIVMHRPDEDRPERRLEIELRNGPPLGSMLIDKLNGRWEIVDPNHERLVRADYGAQLDAERSRKRDAILDILLSEAASGRMYTALQFAEAFENRAGLGGVSTLRERLNVLATKGYVKFVKGEAARALRLGTSRLKHGYLCVEGMVLGPIEEAADAATGEVIACGRPVLPTHFKCPQSGAALPVENPTVWVYADETGD